MAVVSLDSIFTKLALCLSKLSPQHNDLDGEVDVLLHLLGVLSIGCDVSFTLRLLYPVINDWAAGPLWTVRGVKVQLPEIEPRFLGL